MQLQSNNEGKLKSIKTDASNVRFNLGYSIRRNPSLTVPLGLGKVLVGNGSSIFFVRSYSNSNYFLAITY